MSDDDPTAPSGEPLRPLSAQWHLGDEYLDEALALDESDDVPDEEASKKGEDDRASVVVDLASRRARLRP